MGYKIEAFLDQGRPALRIYDINQHSLCLSWVYQGEAENNSEIHKLFRQLLLLTCKQDLHNVRVFNLTPKLDS
ncbi:hypothetical protein [Aliikangiella sp. G2MR2-5]|uniref:hypothetical protein n=1 Tax=Aliikangiella sp. G2MR2-5 TaxID=2788943 RepID=UPI0018A9BCEF|nr:hypothetical protein [Aliikangiella sp. G2MR2-5]